MIIKKGFTLIELITVMAIIGILAGSGAWLMFHTIKNSVFIPNQLNMDKLADDALDIMIEGDSQAHGLRFSRVITGALANQVDFINQDSVAISYLLASGTLSRKIWPSVTYAPLLYYSSIANISGTPFFTYYSSGVTETVNPTLVRRIRINLIAKTGSGTYNDWQGQSEQVSSIAVKKLQ